VTLDLCTLEQSWVEGTLQEVTGGLMFLLSFSCYMPLAMDMTWVHERATVTGAVHARRSLGKPV